MPLKRKNKEKVADINTAANNRDNYDISVICTSSNAKSSGRDKL